MRKKEEKGMVKEGSTMKKETNTATKKMDNRNHHDSDHLLSSFHLSSSAAIF